MSWIVREAGGAGLAAALLVVPGCVDRPITADFDAQGDDDDDGDASDEAGREPDPSEGEPEPVPECTPGQGSCPCPDGLVAQGGVCVAPPADRLVALSPLEQQALAAAAVDAPPVVQLLAADGSPLSGVEVVFAAAQGEGNVLTSAVVLTDAEGIAANEQWIVGKLSGDYAVTASVPSRPEVAPLGFAARTIGDFEITLQYLDAPTPAQEAAFEYARRRWQGIILNAQSVVEIDASVAASQCDIQAASQPLAISGVHIFVRLGPIDGTGTGGVNILGQAGPCVLRDSSSPAVGGMTFDTTDLDMIEASGKLETVILHEMGHVLGVGGLWRTQGLLANPSLPASPGADTHFLGGFAQAAFLDLLGPLAYEGAIVPVENAATPGSSDGHWRESVLTTELMTPSLGSVELPTELSILTIASLLDQGYYEINPYPADPYSFVSMSTSAPDEGAVVNTDEVIAPRAVVSADGVLTPLR